MPSARDIRRRIKSVKNIKQITKAMEMVAAARLRRAQERANACRPFVQKMRDVLNDVASHPENRHHQLLTGRSADKVLYLVVSADKGLAGAYNSNLLREATAQLRAGGYEKLVVSGRKARDFFRRRGFTVAEAFTGMSEKPHFSDATNIADYIMQGYIRGEYNQIRIVYTHFYSAMNHRPTVMPVLPLEIPGVAFTRTKAGQSYLSNLMDWDRDEDEAAEAETEDDFSSDEAVTEEEPMEAKFIVEPTPQDVLERLLPRYIEALVYEALVQSAASELGARMTAMGSATNNAEDIISQLVLNYNKVRQAAITREISEIVGGVEALQ
jgi:F-type H+-transporting ATPase subunit gamma